MRFFSLDVLYAPRLPDLYFRWKSCVLYSRFYGNLLIEFWDPLISLEQLNIQTSNFACGLKVRDTKSKNEKFWKKGAWPTSRDLLFKFWDLLNISGPAKDINLKFYMQTDSKGYQNKKCKSGQKGAWCWSRDLLFKFWDALLSLERLKIQTSSFACRLILHHNCYKLTKFVSKHWWPNDRFSSPHKQHDCSLHYFVRSYCFRKICPDSTGVMWQKIERLWYVKKSEVWKEDDNYNKYCTVVRNQTPAN